MFILLEFLLGNYILFVNIYYTNDTHTTRTHIHYNHISLMMSRRNAFGFPRSHLNNNIIEIYYDNFKSVRQIDHLVSIYCLYSKYILVIVFVLLKQIIV